MLAFSIWIYLISTFTLLSAALPIPVYRPVISSDGSTTDLGPSAPSTDFSLSATHSITRRHARDFFNTSNEQQAETVIPFPKYAVALLALFIVVCAVSSAIITILLLSKTSPARQRISTLASRIWSPRTRTPPPSERGERGGENAKAKPEEDILYITRNNNASIVLKDAQDKSARISTVSSSVEKADTDRTFSTASDNPESNVYGKISITHKPSRGTSSHSVSLKASSSAESLNTLVTTNTKALQRLSNVVPFLADAVGVIPGDTSSTKSENMSSVPNNPYIQASLTPSENNDKNSDYTGSPQHSTSSTAFYSLADVLSPSVAVYSLVDLDTLTKNEESGSITSPINFLGVVEERDITDAFSSSRYIPGEQLETIQEESESFSSMTLTRLNSISSSPSKKSPQNPSTDTQPAIHENEELHLGDNPEAILSDEFANTRLLASISLTDRIPTTWEELAVDPQNPSLPRFFPAARPAPSPSAPTSGIARVPALRSPYRNEEQRHSVAWLSPVIEWAVDDPRENVNERNTIRPEEDDESEDAQSAADAMAAVMDSLAAIGMDPTNMGLMTEDTVSDPFPDSPPLSDVLVTGENAKPQVSIMEQKLVAQIGSDLEQNAPTSAPIKEEKIVEKGHDEHFSNVLSSSHEQSGSSDIGQGFTRTHDIEDSVSARGANPVRSPDRRRSTGSPVDLNFRAFDKRSKPTSATGGIGSPSTSQTFRTPRSVKPDRVYPSPSSLAALSPAEVAKRFSIESASSTGSTPPPRDKRPISPVNHHSSPVSPLQIRKFKETLFSPTLRSTPSTLTSSPSSDPGSPSPCSQSHLFYGQIIEESPSTPRALSSPRRPTTPIQPLSRRNLQQSSSFHTLSQRPKPAAISQVTLSSLILQERSNSMEFV